MKGILIFAVCYFTCTALVAQTFTMGKDCREKDGQALGMLKEKKYPEALEAYQLMAKSCKTKDAKETIAVGKAEAYNGMGKFEDALHTINALLARPNLPENTKKAAEYRKKSFEFGVEFAKAHANDQYVFSPKNLGDGVNSEESEYFPSLPVNGSELYFTRRLGNFNEDFFGSIRSGNYE